jgi:hypothetical protein
MLSLIALWPWLSFELLVVETQSGVWELITLHEHIYTAGLVPISIFCYLIIF